MSSSSIQSAVWDYFKVVPIFVPPLGAALFLMAGFLFDLLDQSDAGWRQLSFIFGAVAGFLFLSVHYGAFHQTRRSNFDVISGAEAIVAYGIFSLVFGITLSALIARPVLEQVMASGVVEVGGVFSLIFRIGEGLIMAGLCPFAAVLMRQLDMRRSPDDIASGDLPDPAQLAASMQKLTDAFDSNSNAIRTHLNSLAIAVEASSITITTEIGKMDGAMSGMVQNSTDLANALGSAKTQSNDLTIAIKALDDASRKATDLMEGLSELIAQVDDFTRKT